MNIFFALKGSKLFIIIYPTFQNSILLKQPSNTFVFCDEAHEYLHPVLLQLFSSELSKHSWYPLHTPRNEIVSPEEHMKYLPLSLSPTIVRVPLNDSKECVALYSPPINTFQKTTIIILQNLDDFYYSMAVLQKMLFVSLFLLKT